MKPLRRDRFFQKLFWVPLAGSATALLVVGGVLGFFFLGLGGHGRSDFAFSLKSLLGANTKAVILVADDVCPPGFEDPAAAGWGPNANWDKKYLRMHTTPSVDNEGGGMLVTGVIDQGGSTTVPLPAHSHQLATRAGVGLPGGGENIPSTSGGAQGVFTYSMGGGNTHWQPYLALKPCIWIVN